MSKTVTPKPYFIWSCILHVSILLALILSVSLSGTSAPSSSSNNTEIIHAVAVSAQVLQQYQQAQQAAAKKAQDLLKAEQARQLVAEKAAAEKVAAEKLAEEKAAELAGQKAAAKAAALKKSLEKQLRESMQKQIIKDEPKPNAKSVPATPTKSNTKSTPAKSASTENKATTDNKSTASNVNPGLMDKYKAAIIQAISEQWIVPENLPKNISCILSVRVAPGGIVLDVSVTKSSGDPVLDNSAVAAVKKASPLPVPTDANLFDAFRTLKLTVKPDGSLLEG